MAEFVVIKILSIEDDAVDHGHGLVDVVLLALLGVNHIKTSLLLHAEVLDLNAEGEIADLLRDVLGLVLVELTSCEEWFRCLLRSNKSVNILFRVYCGLCQIVDFSNQLRELNSRLDYFSAPRLKTAVHKLDKFLVSLLLHIKLLTEAGMDQEHALVDI